jgi:lambda family phage portal protein
VSAPQILNASGDPIPNVEIDRIRLSAMINGPVSDYEAPYHASSIWSQDTASWRPPLRSGDFGNLVRRDLTIARLQDIIRNDAHASTGLDKLVDMIVGPGLNFSAKPDADALRLEDRNMVRGLKKDMQTEWRLFANDPRKICDIQRRLTGNGLLRLLARTWLAMGEAAYVVTLNDVRGARYETSILTVDPDRICNPYGERDTLTRRGGVEMDKNGAPIGYWVRDAHVGDYWAPSEQVSWTYVPRETEWGRPVFVHGFEPLRDGDTRGTSPLIPIVTRLRMLGKFADNELASATINALMAATIETDMPLDEVAQRMQPQEALNAGFKNYIADTYDWYQKHPAKVGGVRVPVLRPGSSLKLNNSPRQTTAFPAFESAFLQTVASKLGLAYEQLKGDWTKTNYSSARAALNEVWRTIKRMSSVFVDQIVTPLQLVWADEAFDKRYLKEPEGCPLFWDMPGAYLNSRWIGPGKGYVDPVKEAEAPGVRIENMISTLEDENAEQGVDLEERLDQIQYEEESLKERGLTRLSLVAAVQQTRGPKPDSEEAVGPAGPGGDATGKEHASDPMAAFEKRVARERRLLRMALEDEGRMALEDANEGA